MSEHTGATLRMLDYLRTNGEATSPELGKLVGIETKNVTDLLGSHVTKGTLARDLVKWENTRSVSRYTWIGDDGTNPIFIPAVTPKTPQSSGLRRCLGPDCGRMFKSTHAGNRICPTCKAAIARAGGGNSFNTPQPHRHR